MAPQGKTLVSLVFLEGRLCYTNEDSVGASVAAAKSYGQLLTLIKPIGNQWDPDLPVAPRQEQ